jgi:L-fuculose-phosphate aldolase
MHNATTRMRSCMRMRRSPRRSHACIAAYPPSTTWSRSQGGSDIRCAPYATFGTQALSDNVIGALAGRTACLMANHGLIAVGRSLDAALSLAVEVETLAEMYWRALQVGEPVLLPDDEMHVVLAKFSAYGKP